MPDDYDDDTPDAPPQKSALRQRMADLEERAKRLEEVEARASRLEKELAIRDAGVELDTLQRKALFAVHEGEYTPELIRDTATKLGFGSPPPAPHEGVPEQAALNRIGAASAGAVPPGVADADADLTARLAGAKSEAEFRAIYAASGRPMAR